MPAEPLKQEPAPVEYPFPEAVPLTREELAIIEALAREAAQEYLSGTVDEET